MANIFSHAWQEDRGLDLAGLIQAIQDPPFERVGIMNLDSFYPAKERFALAMRINNLLAAPGFGAWLEGDPLSIPDLLHTADGRPNRATSGRQARVDRTPNRRKPGFPRYVLRGGTD